MSTVGAMLAANVYVLPDVDASHCERQDCERAATHSVEVGLTDGGTLSVPLCRSHTIAFIEHVLTHGKPSQEWQQ